jgi:hypothetical protein
MALAWALPAWAGPGPEIVDPEEARSDPDFAVQGEYLGEGTLPDGPKGMIGAQVVALGEGKFAVELFAGGLPGAGWKRGDRQVSLSAKRENGAAAIEGPDVSGQIDGKSLTLCDAAGKVLAKLSRTERKSPTLGEKPPQGATFLFDGSSAEHFKDGVLTDMQTLEAGCTAKEKHPMKRLHLELRLSWRPAARGQGRSNSGVYITGVPEIQVLDSFGLEGKRNECGALYGRQEPAVNLCLPPLVWQTYDVEFTQPGSDAQGKPSGPVLVTVRHNGVVVHDKYEVRGKLSDARGIHLQRHGNRVQYRNIWIVPPEGAR